MDMESAFVGGNQSNHMSIQTIIDILQAHLIDYRITSNRVEAGSTYTNVYTGESGVEWEDVTGWSMGQIRQWLGY